MSEQLHTSEVVIIGGGITGGTLAVALADAGVAVLVVERAQPKPFLSLGRDCRVSTLCLGVVQALEKLGAWPAEQAASVRAMQIWEGEAAGGMEMHAAELDAPALGAVIENRHLVAALRARAEALGARWLLDAPEALECGLDAARLRLASGACVQAQLVVGADGARSWLRRQLDVAWLGRSYRQGGITATVRLAEPHRGIAYQRFFPTGPLALLPLAGEEERLASIVWSASDGLAERLMRMDDAAFSQALAEALGPIAGGLVEVGARAAFPLARAVAAHWVRPRAALIGDAAHLVHPLAGLGANLGIRDALALADELSRAQALGEDLGAMEVLARYRDRRVADIGLALAGLEGLHQFFSLRWPGVSALRALGLSLFHNLVPVKVLAMRYAAGLATDLPLIWR